MAEVADPNKYLAKLRRECPSFEEDGVTYWIVESDLLFTEDQLADYAIRWAENAALQQEDPEEKKTKGLVGMVASGRRIRWSKGLVLTYRVDKTTFRSESEYRQVVSATAAAAREWENACNVRFLHLEEYDGGIPLGAPPPLFAIVRAPWEANAYAVAFFPTTPPEQRILWIYSLFFHNDANPYGQTGIMRHELGHILGFRHEHVHPEAPGVCKPEKNDGALAGTQPKALTPYDILSVMHYICPDANRLYVEWTLSDYDRKGAASLYGTPDGLHPPPDHLMDYRV